MQHTISNYTGVTSPALGSIADYHASHDMACMLVPTICSLSTLFASPGGHSYSRQTVCV